MARPSVAVERREQIIDATMTTIAEHGISGTSLDRIADAVGMSRGHVRHFVGNRDRLLLDTAIALFADHTGKVGSILPSDVADVEGALDYLFGPEFNSPDRENAVVLGFVELSRTTPEIAEVLTTAYTATRLQLADLVAADHTDASPDTCVTVAYGILTCALGSVFLGDFDADPTRMHRSRAAAEALLAAL
ncbi:TetR family transcriptional regulator [Microbacterium sp. Root61]|uniref:TetR/AcrR family transcriptional regulator n=1 Tax=Microbacterium sp. Root61 TaxID=1736570 RepID=UPI0006F41F1F|nr:TetR/AcrR family transcriptional regulator [Microbacterium sp. Root61]KRA24921.1 TetR family transcriptional regulator [Microbacterium sp. Root61]